MKPMVKFEPVRGRVAHVDPDCLQNQDEKLLLGYCLLVQNGPQNDEDLKIAHRKPGKVCASRWVTTASSILCLYTQTENPSPNLKLMVGFIVNVYAPALFLAKGDWHCSKGPIHFFNLLMFARDYLEQDHPELLEKVNNVLKFNSFWAHPENMLVAMAMGPNPDLNVKALEIIAKLRKSKAKRIRKFRKPGKFINFQAKTYDQLIDFKQFKPSLYSSPPLFNNHSLQDIKTKTFDDDIMKVPAHSQHVERFVYLTSQAGLHARGEEAMNAWVLNKVASSEKFPSKSTKAHFLPLQKK